MGVWRRMQVDTGNGIFQIAVHQPQAALARQICGAQHIRRVGRHHHVAQAIGQGHGPDPFGQLTLLDVEGGIGKRVGIAHVVEVRMGNENGIHILRTNAAWRKYIFGRMPVFDQELLGNIAAIFLVVVAHIDHGDMVIALDQDVTVGQLSDALVMRAVDDAAYSALAHVGVFQNPDGVFRHRRYQTFSLEGACAVAASLAEVEWHDAKGLHRRTA